MISEPRTKEFEQGAHRGMKGGRSTRLAGLRAGMVVFSSYPADPRPRRAIDALLSEGMAIDLICQADSSSPRRQVLGRLAITRVPIRNARGGVVSYVWQYFAFIAISAVMFAWRSFRQRYDLIYVHNMPDVLVLAAFVPKLFGARVILDQHDPMPELLMTIFGKRERSLGVQLLRRLEKLSFLCADRIITVNAACRRIFTARSCRADKVDVIMNCPDEALFPFRDANSWPQHDREKPFVVMYHGSLVERNGLGLAVEALAILLRTLPNLELRVYGPRTEYLNLALERAQALGVERYVRYLGARQLEELACEIEQCDMGIIPNQRNTFTDINTPTRIFEYLALGKPVIAPATPGILDYFDRTSLFFFEAGNAADLARAMESAASSPDQARETARLGQQVYRSHTWSNEREILVRTVATLVHGPALDTATIDPPPALTRPSASAGVATDKQ